MFAYESELCAVLAGHLRQLECRGIRFRYQLQVGAEIPDFVVTQQVGRAVPKVTTIESAILAQLLHGSSSIENAAMQLYTRCERVAIGLARLRRIGLVREPAPDSWCLQSQELLASRIIAIEAKLTRWQDALEQAVNYRRFANLSFVALPLDVVVRRSEELRADCARHEIGLLGVSHTSLHIEVPAPSHDPWGADWVWTVVRMLSDSGDRHEMRRASCVDGSSSFVD